MPFKSKAQARYMFSQHPKIAKEFASQTKSFSKLPERASNPKTGTTVPTMSRSRAQAFSLKLGLRGGIHRMPGGKFHPGASHEIMINALGKRFNRKK